MKAKVFLREEKVYKTVDITDNQKPQINNELLEKWQGILNTISELIGVSSSVIMKISPESLEVFLKDENENNPYQIGAAEALGTGLYCETVVGKNDELYIENALDQETWRDNPAVHSNMISYYGQPVQWSDGEFFGTICIMNQSEIDLTDTNKHVITEFKNVIESDLKILENEETFESFFEISLDLLCIATVTGDFIRVNNSWERVFGYSILELKSMNFMDLVHPEDLKITEEAINELKNNEKILNFINRFRDKNGNDHFIEWNSKIAGHHNYIYASARDITEQVTRNKEIEQRKKELDFILTGVDAGTWQWNVQTGKTKFNRRWAELLGYELNELEPTDIETWRNLIHPTDLIIAEENLQEHFKGKIQKYDVEIRMKHKDGHWLWMNDLGKVLSWTEENEPYEMFGVHIDVSERKEKEEKILGTKALLENLSNQVPGTIYQFRLSADGTMNFPYASKGIYEIYELLPKDVKNDAAKAFNRIHPDDYNQVYRSIQKSAKKLTPWHEVYRVNLPEKGIKWLEGKSIPEKLEDGSILWHGYLSDITEKKQRQEKVKASERKYKTIFKSAPNPVFLMDSKGSIQDVNYKTIELLGYSKDRLLEMNILDLVAPEDNKKVNKATKKLIEAQQMSMELELITNEMDKATIILDAVYLTEDLYLGFAKNITQRIKEREILNFQYQFQRKLAEITSNILDIDATNFNEKISFSLEKIGKVLNVDYGYLYKYEKDLKHFSLTHEWCKSRQLPHKKTIQIMKSEKFPWPWWIEKLLNKETILIEKINEQSIQGQETSDIIQDNSVNSIIVNPIFIESTFYGFFGFDRIEGQSSFNKKDVELVELFTDIMKNAINKHFNDLEIQKLTYKDHLTGLYNRRFFEEELKRLDTKRQLPISIIVADINGLKIINDSLGHKKGDLFIQKAANILREVTREEDILSRLSGDEFALILPKTNRDSVKAVIQRINDGMKLNSNALEKVSMALGYAVKKNEDQRIEEVIQEADNNMYQNKLLSSSSVKGRIVQNLMSVLAVKSNETKAHAIRMKKLVIDISKVLELDNSEINRLSLLATLHDIGKITISEAILKKPSELTNEEWEIVKGHCENGYRIANASEEFAIIAKEIFSHHERWDGNGYPKKLRGKDIPYLARIITIIDAYDVMTHNQHYKKAITKEEALNEIKKCAGGQFDPSLVSVFIDILDMSSN